MLRRLLSWSLWPLAVSALIASIISFADLRDPASIAQTLGLTILLSLVVLLALEVVLPYRKDWNVRGDRDIWRDIGHYVLYAQAGNVGAQLLFLVVLATALEGLSCHRSGR